MKALITSPFITQGTRQSVCVKIPLQNIEVSIAFDNGCRGELKTCCRDDVRVYDKATGNDITESVFGAPAYGNSGKQFVELLNKANEFDTKNY